MARTMSADPSPWAEGDYDEPIMSTSVMLKEAEADRAAADREAERNELLWRKYAGRLRADGGLTR